MKIKFFVGLILAVATAINSCGQNPKTSESLSVNTQDTGTAQSTCSITTQQSDQADSQQKKSPLKVSILGDSYSTFAGYIPENFIAWYMPVPKEGRPTDVTSVDQTWWDIFIKENGYELEKNNSYSGSTICNTGYNREDYSDRSFISRVNQLGNPDLILVYGGTNDSWAGSPLGDFVYSDWTDKQLKSFRPATAYLANELKKVYPNARIAFLVNGPDILKPEIIESMQKICNHYGIEYVMIEDIDKMSGHPSQKGMKQIVAQLNEALSKQQ